MSDPIDEILEDANDEPAGPLNVITDQVYNFNSIIAGGHVISQAKYVEPIPVPMGTILLTNLETGQLVPYESYDGTAAICPRYATVETEAESLDGIVLTDGGSTTYVLDTDYSIEGMDIFVIDSGALAEAESCEYTLSEESGTLTFKPKSAELGLFHNYRLYSGETIYTPGEDYILVEMEPEATSQVVEFPADSPIASLDEIDYTGFPFPEGLLASDRDGDDPRPQAVYTGGIFYADKIPDYDQDIFNNVPGFAFV